MMNNNTMPHNKVTNKSSNNIQKIAKVY
uniref:Uncharacterized protein n=1 Tax=Rhizophora mucronata TaxID=61149 RepID=A0A2P2JDX2_RHIMU